MSINSKVPIQVLLSLALMLPAAAGSASEEPYRVLVLNSVRSSLPANMDWYRGIANGFASADALRVEIETEAPDLSRIRDQQYAEKLLAVYRYKYRGHQPHLIIPTYTSALGFLLEYGENLFPGVPIVFLHADSQFVAARQLASHITGITSHLDIEGTLELALQVHPNTRRVAMIVGSGELDMQLERLARQAIQPLEGTLEFTWLQGLPMGELTRAVRALPEHTVVLYLVQLEDRTGKLHVPFTALQELSSVAKVPIYGLWDTLLGSGIVGGRLVTLGKDGFAVAQMGLRILNGEAPATIPVVDRQTNSAIFDARELARWDIDVHRLPMAHQILHGQTSLWAEHRTAIIATGLLVGLQGFLILALFLNQWRLKRVQTSLQHEVDRRAQAETDATTLRERVARFSKEQSLGALASGMAHEINQPLAAIQNYAKAARKRSSSSVDQTAKLDELLEKIDDQATRAGAVVQHIRSLFSKRDSELRPVTLYPVIDHVLQTLRTEIESGGSRIELRPDASVPAVLADELEIELVLINLLQNAAHAMRPIVNQADNAIHVEIRQINAHEVKVSVADRGPGIPEDIAAEMFEPYCSGGQDGMGMGLHICKTIIDNHGGRMKYRPNPGGGAVFEFTLQPAPES